MRRIKLYFDEDAMNSAVVAALRARGIDVVTASERSMINQSDEAHLTRASSEGRSLYSFNIQDYTAIHARGAQHHGIILAVQQRYPIGEQVRRLLHLLSRTSADEMQNRVEYLSFWGR